MVDIEAMDNAVLETLVSALDHQLDWDGTRWKPKKIGELKAERALAAKTIRYLRTKLRELSAVKQARISALKDVVALIDKCCDPCPQCMEAVEALLTEAEPKEPQP